MTKHRSAAANSSLRRALLLTKLDDVERQLLRRLFSYRSSLVDWDRNSDRTIQPIKIRRNELSLDARELEIDPRNRSLDQLRTREEPCPAHQGGVSVILIE